MQKLLADVSTNIAKLSEQRELNASLTYRQIFARYRQPVLGLAWAVFRPIATVLTFTVVFSFVAKFPSDGLPCPLFVFGALLSWTLLSSGLGSGVSSLTNQLNLVSKIYFSREVLPISRILASAIELLIATLIFVVLLIAYQVELSWNILYAIPILIIGISMLVARRPPDRRGSRARWHA